MKCIRQYFLLMLLTPFVFYGQYGITSYGNNAGSNLGSSHFGEYAGNHVGGTANSFFGWNTGRNSANYGNAFFGNHSGRYSSSGQFGTMLGYYSGHYTTTGSRNVFLGAYSGYNNSTGSDNVFIGYQAGYSELSGNKLYIENSNSSTPLIYGKFDTDQIGINTTNIPTGYTLAVKDKIITEEIKIRSYAYWPDFVFEDDYQLPSLYEVESFIERWGHLKEIPTATETLNNGFLLAEMDAKLLRKIEELTLYTIQQERKLEAQKKKNADLEARLKRLEQLVENKTEK